MIEKNTQIVLPTRQQIFYEDSLELGVESLINWINQKSNSNTPSVKEQSGELLIGNVHLIYKEALTTFYVAFTKYSEILPEARPKIQN